MKWQRAPNRQSEPGRKAAPSQEGRSLVSTLDTGTATSDVCDSVQWVLIADNKVCWLNALIFQRSLNLYSQLFCSLWLFYCFQPSLQQLKECMGSRTKKLLHPNIVSYVLGKTLEEC